MENILRGYFFSMNNALGISAMVEETLWWAQGSVGGHVKENLQRAWQCPAAAVASYQSMEMRRQWRRQGHRQRPASRQLPA